MTHRHKQFYIEQILTKGLRNSFILNQVHAKKISSAVIYIQQKKSLKYAYGSLGKE